MLRAVRRVFAPANGTEPIVELLRQEPDWPRLLELARRNRVVPLLLQGLTGCPGPPESVLHDLRERTETVRRKNLALTEALHRILALCRAHDVRILSFKGPELACEAYGDIGLRPFGDIDLLIHPKDIARVTAVLPPQGFPLRAACAWQHFFRSDDGVGLDVHWALGPRWMRSPADFEEWWANAREIPVEGEPVPTLSVEDLVLVLSLMLAKDCMFRRQRLVQLCDIAALVSRHPALDGPALLARARRLDLHRMVLVQGILASELLDAPLPVGFAEAARAEPAVGRLVREARSGFLGETIEPTTDEGLGPGPGLTGHRFFLRSQARFGHRAHYLGVIIPAILRMVVTPTERDREFLPMARSWRPVHYLVRPVRVLRRWARTGYLILD